MLQAEFSANAKKATRVKAKTPVIQGNSKWYSACSRSSVALERNERDLKDQERFEWTEDDDTADWPHAAEHIEESKGQIKDSAPRVTLDLNSGNLILNVRANKHQSAASQLSRLPVKSCLKTSGIPLFPQRR